jgi:hypothetical protein
MAVERSGIPLRFLATCVAVLLLYKLDLTSDDFTHRAIRRVKLVETRHDM